MLNTLLVVWFIQWELVSINLRVESLLPESFLVDF